VLLGRHAETVASPALAGENQKLSGFLENLTPARAISATRAAADGRQTVIDPSSHPELFDELLGELGAIMERETP
jgi:hypothetical protein